MEIQTIMVKATLVRASKIDLFTNEEVPKENKVLFFKDPTTGSFKDIYRITSTDKYQILELYKGMCWNALYVLTEKHCANDFCFKLILRTANEFDLFDAPKWIKQNVLYYEMENKTSVIGPNYIDQFTNVERIMLLMNEGKIFVPGKQHFEPITYQKSA